MSPIEKDIIKRKIAVIVENLNALEPISRMALEKYTEIEDYIERESI